MSNASLSNECDEEVTLLSIKAGECYKKRRELLHFKDQQEDQKYIEKMNDLLRLADLNLNNMNTIIEKKKSLSMRKHTIRTIIENNDKQSAASISLPHTSHESLSDILADTIEMVNNILEVKASLMENISLNIDPIMEELTRKTDECKYNLASQQFVRSQIEELGKKIHDLSEINRDQSTEDTDFDDESAANEVSKNIT